MFWLLKGLSALLAVAIEIAALAHPAQLDRDFQRVFYIFDSALDNVYEPISLRLSKKNQLASCKILGVEKKQKATRIVIALAV